MGGGRVDWDSPETWQRLVAAILATDAKVDLKQTALYFGTTFDTLQNRFRRIKKESATLQAAVNNGERTEVSTPSRGTPKKSATLQAAVNNKERTEVSTPSRGTPKKSATLQAAVNNQERTEVSTPSRGTPKKSAWKKDPLTAVTNGRVAKSIPRKKSTVKQEAADSFSFSHGVNGVNGVEDDDGLGLLT